MVCNPLVHEFLLLALLWQLVFWHGVGKRGQAPKHPSTPQPKSLPKTPKPFAGLTQKPPCQACEQGPAHGTQSSLSPAPILASKRGRPRAIDTHSHYCPEKTCSYYGWVARGNIRANGHPGSGPWRQLHCVVCQTYFLETQGTVFHHRRGSSELLVRVVGALAEGVGLRAVARIFEVEPCTVLQWLGEAADQLHAFSQYWLHDVPLSQVQLDELFAVLSEARVDESSEAKTLARPARSSHWVWVALDPVSKLLLAIEVGERSLAMAQRVVHHVVQVLAPGCIPLFLTDGLKAYATAILTHFGDWVPPPRPTLTSPRSKPRWMPLPEVLYAQVVKTYRRRRLVGMRPRVVFGTLARVLHVLAPRGWHINTAFVERVNLTIRHHVAALGRRVVTRCKREAGLRAQLHLYHLYYNFCLPHISLRVPLAYPQPTKGRGSMKRWHPCTPAMAARLTDHVWPLREVLLFRVPPWPQSQGL